MEMKDKVVVLSSTTIILGCAILSKCKLKKKRNRQIWLKDWLRVRDEKGAYANILQELRLTDHEHYQKYLRMNSETFQVI